jgi:hypothetical protein
MINPPTQNIFHMAEAGSLTPLAVMVHLLECLEITLDTVLSPIQHKILFGEKSKSTLISSTLIIQP